MPEKPPEWAAKLLEGQARQGETLNGMGDSLRKQSDTLNGLGISQAKLETTVDHIKDQAKEGREADRKTRVELEGKVTKVHDRVNELDGVAGQFKNHVKDEHATKAAETAVKLEEHIDDNNRHGGASPGAGGAVKTAGIAAGGVAGGGGILWGIYEIVKVFATG